MRTIKAKRTARTAKQAASVGVTATLTTTPAIADNAENEITTPDESAIAAMRGEMLPGADTTASADLATPPAPAIEAAAPDTSADKAARRASDRAAVHAVYAGFERNRVSVPVKPLSAFKPLPAAPHANGRNPSVRQAAAFVAAAASAGVPFVAGGIVPRRFDFISPVSGEPVPSCIENGCVSDALRSGIVTVAPNSEPGAENFVITPAGFAFVRSNIGEPALRRYGIHPDQHTTA